MNKLILALALVSSTAFATPIDLEWPTAGNYRSGFFAADYSALSAGDVSAWITPGDRFCRVAYQRNCDDTASTTQQLRDALTEWNAFTTCERWRIRLHHQSLIRRPSTSIIRIETTYANFISASRLTEIRSCIAVGTFDYLGATFTPARSTIVGRRSAAFWREMWPDDTKMDTVVFGFESDGT